MVPGARIELAHPFGYQILSLARLPVPPPRQRFVPSGPRGAANEDVVSGPNARQV